MESSFSSDLYSTLHSTGSMQSSSIPNCSDAQLEAYYLSESGEIHGTLLIMDSLVYFEPHSLCHSDYASIDISDLCKAKALEFSDYTSQGLVVLLGIYVSCTNGKSRPFGKSPRVRLLFRIAPMGGYAMQK